MKDEYSGANFGASESSDTKVVSGTYTVVLPDGRVQTVKYTADDYAGYVADVSVSIISIPINVCVCLCVSCREKRNSTSNDLISLLSC